MSGNIENKDNGNEGNIEDDNSNEESASKKTKIEDSSSPVWKYAKKLGGGRGQCNICNKIYSLPKGNTSNLRDHILEAHKKTKEGIELQKLVDEKRKATEQKKKAKEQVAMKNERKVITSFIKPNGSAKCLL